MGLTSRELNKGGITPLKRLKYGSHKSLIADNGCLSHGMFGNQLRRTLISRTQLYISSHLASPAAITAIGVPMDIKALLLWLIAAKKSGLASIARVLIGFGRGGRNLRERRREILEERCLESERARATRVAMVRVDPVSGG